MYWKSAQMNFYKKSGVGSCVARSTTMGNARSLEVWSGQLYGLHAFLYIAETAKSLKF